MWHCNEKFSDWKINIKEEEEESSIVLNEPHELSAKIKLFSLCGRLRRTFVVDVNGEADSERESIQSERAKMLESKVLLAIVQLVWLINGMIWHYLYIDVFVIKVSSSLMSACVLSTGERRLNGWCDWMNTNYAANLDRIKSTTTDFIIAILIFICIFSPILLYLLADVVSSVDCNGILTTSRIL